MKSLASANNHKKPTLTSIKNLSFHQSEVCELVKAAGLICQWGCTIKTQPKLIKKSHKYNSRDLTLVLWNEGNNKKIFVVGDRWHSDLLDAADEITNLTRIFGTLTDVISRTCFNPKLRSPNRLAKTSDWAGRSLWMRDLIERRHWADAITKHLLGRVRNWFKASKSLSSTSQPPTYYQDLGLGTASWIIRFGGLNLSWRRIDTAIGPWTCDVTGWSPRIVL